MNHYRRGERVDIVGLTQGDGHVKLTAVVGGDQGCGFPKKGAEALATPNVATQR